MRRIQPRLTLDGFARALPLDGAASTLGPWLIEVARESVIPNPTLPSELVRATFERALAEGDDGVLRTYVTHRTLGRRQIDRLLDAEVGDDVYHALALYGRLLAYDDADRLLAHAHPRSFYDTVWTTGLTRWSSHRRGEEILARTSPRISSAWFAATAHSGDPARLGAWLGDDPYEKDRSVDAALRLAIEWYPERFGEFVRADVPALSVRCAGSRLLTDLDDQWILAGLSPSGEPEDGWPGERTRTLVGLINNPRTLDPVLDALAEALGPSDPAKPRTLASTLARRRINHRESVTGPFREVDDPSSLAWLLRRCGVDTEAPGNRRRSSSLTKRPYDALDLAGNTQLDSSARAALDEIADEVRERPANDRAAFVELTGDLGSVLPTSTLLRSEESTRAALSLAEALDYDPVNLARYFALGPTWTDDEASLRETVRSLSDQTTGARA